MLVDKAAADALGGDSKMSVFELEAGLVIGFEGDKSESRRPTLFFFAIFCFTGNSYFFGWKGKIQNLHFSI